jgi:hypothetical protein
MAAAARSFDVFDGAEVHRAFLVIDPEPEGFEFFRPMLRYWSERAAGRAAPRRSDIDPLDLPLPMLPHVLLIEVEHDPLDFRYRLAGTAADTIHGQSLKGVRISELRPETFARTLHDDLARMADDLAPQFLELSYTNREGKTRRYRVLRLPLCDDAGRMAMVLILANHGAITA